jgi:hypothetical protein
MAEKRSARVSDTEPKPPPNEPRQPTRRTPTEARQSIRGGRMIWVLIGGIVLVVIAYLVIGVFTEVQRPPPSVGVVSGSSSPASGSAKPPAH